LQLRKQLLVAESELNRAQLIEEWQAMTAGVHTLTARVKSISSLASTAALLIAGVSAFRSRRGISSGAKSSWLQMAMKGTKVAGSLWLALRARPKRENAR
jgi:hypothetical protein